VTQAVEACDQGPKKSAALAAEGNRPNVSGGAN
jgi:hypothetical protein